MSSLRFRAVVVAALAIAGLAGATACGAGFLEGLTGGEDASSPPPAVTTNVGCVGLVPPDGASTTDDSAPIDPLTFAFQTVRITSNPLVDSSAPPPIGYNQDHLCTCPERESCVAPDSGSAHQAICDGDGGTDNGLAGFFSLLAAGIPEFREDFVGDRVGQGLFTILVEVSNWNGTPNDPQVRVRFSMSSGLDRDATGRRTPNFDGTDVWFADPGTLVNGAENVGKDCRAPQDGGAICSPTVVDGFGFVRDGKLYAHPGNADGILPLLLQSSVGRISIELGNAYFVTTLTEESAGLWRMQGEMGGRWSAQSILNALANIENPYDKGTAFCETADASPSAYATLKTGVCGGLDLPATTGLDSILGSPCSAVSSALSFVAYSATIGHVGDSTLKNSACIDWKDDCTR